MASLQKLQTSPSVGVKAVIVSGAILFSSLIGLAQIAITTQHNDNSRTGANLNETILNTSNVNVAQFGKLFSRAVDGQVYAQPLYLPNVSIGQTVHNVVYVATMRNNLYAFDADDPAAAAPLWQVNFGPPVPHEDVSSPEDIDDVIGITSTPVIDTTTGTLYAVAKSKENNAYFQRLHAVDIATGQERPGSPVVITGTVPGTGDDSVNGVVTFNPLRHLNRPALVLSNGYIYIAFGPHEDQRPYHGWVFSYDAATLQRVGIFNDTPTGFGGGIWSSGQGPIVDESGNLYLSTANGSFNKNTGGQDCSSCFLKLSGPSLTVLDWFAPGNQFVLNTNNFELSSSGPVLLPGTNNLVGGGKEGVLYVIDRNNMGHFQAGSNSQIVQAAQITFGNHLHGSPVYWNSPEHGPVLYLWYEENRLMAFRIVNGMLENNVNPNTGLLTPLMQSTMAAPQGMPGGVLSLSANGSTPGTGILWATTPLSQDAQPQTVAGVFRAFDASDITRELWNSRQNAARDDFGNFAKYTPPTIANGKVYLATFSNQLVVYGLLGPQAAPTVTSVTPNLGATSGGTAITVRGTGFGAGATVALGGVAASSVAVVDGTTITATTPAHAAGVVDVTVTNSDGQSGTIAGGFTYLVAPTVTGVTPASGPTVGGTAITISGANFGAGAAVALDGLPATNVSVLNATTITAVTPAHSTGPVDVTVTNTDGQSGTRSSGFLYTALQSPTVTGVSPNSGPTFGGTAVTITGTNFVTGATADFGGVAALSVTVVNATTITATAPAHAAGTVSVAVTNPDAQTGTRANAFTYVSPTNPIVIENQQPGSTGWDPDMDHVGTDAVGQIKGYASVVSVNKGENITLYVSVNPAQTYTIDIYRIGYYQGLGGRLMQHIGPLNGTKQATCPVDPTYGTIECHWTPSYTLAIPATWTSGIYIGTLTNAQGFKNYLTFVVRDDSRVAALIYQQPVTTYQADNNYPNDGQTGKSLYDYTSYGPITVTGYRSAAKVSFDRPYLDSGIGYDFNGDTAEINFVRWMERSGYDVTYSTDVDTHSDGARLLNYRGFISAGHDEYWSKQMFDSVAAARDAGVNLAFFGGNAIYWQIRFEPSSTGVPNRVIVCYKDEFIDPITDPSLKTANWRGDPVNRPEQTLMGVQYTVSIPEQDNQGFFPSFVVTNSSHWVYAGTGFKDGDAVRGLVGYETDRYFANEAGPPAVPGTHTLLSHSAWGSGPDDYSNSSIYQAASGAWVYATGSMDWNWGLDDYGHGYNLVDARIQRTAANVLDRFVGAPVQPSPTVTTVTPSGGPIGGGTVITIRGTNFLIGASVTVGGGAATGVTVVNDTTITATTPSHAAGQVPVVVINPDGRSGSLSNGFTYSSTGPTISSISPNAGPTSGGTAITLIGTNYAAGATVTLGGVVATNMTVVNATTITATTPAHAAGAVAVSVTNSDGQSASLAAGFTYRLPAPTIASVTPISGPTAGGTAITVTGTNFVAGAAVTVGGAVATGVTVVNATTITATTPAHAAGAVAVSVTNSDGQSATLANAFTYVGANPAPVVTSVTPGSGPTTGGTTLTISGANFLAGATVTVGGTAATGVTVVNGTTITATSPGHAAGTVDVGVTNPDVQSGTLANAFTYVQPTTISFVQVNSATPQVPTTTVQVAFPSAQTPGDLNVIAVGTNDTTSVVQSLQDTVGNTYLLAIGPTTGTGLRQWIYYAPNIIGGANTVTVTFNQPAAYADVRILEYRGVNALDVVAGASGTGTTSNSGNATTTGPNELIFGAHMVSSYTAAVGPGFTGRVYTPINSDLAEDKIAATAGVYNATASVGSGNWVMQMAAFKLLTAPAPTVTSVAPSSGSTAGGTTVTITGTGFAAGASVSVGGTAATGVTVVNATTITAATPAHAVGVVDVVVTNTDGQSGTLANAFTYASAPPTVTSVAPNIGSTAGGTAITITGTGFGAGATMTVGGAAATGVTVVNATTITATTPAHAAGAVDVVVTNTDGQSGTLPSAFTYALAPAPTVTSVAPNTGSMAGGTAVTITGTGFAAGASVSVGGTAATGVTVVNATTITAATPAHAAGAVSVTVTNGDGQSGTLANAFTYASAPPTVTNVMPSSGSTAGGTAITITGTGFAAGATATVGGTAATGVTVVNATTITATTPAHAAGAVSVTVTNGDGQSATLANAFTYGVSAPTVTGISPTSGPGGGGTTVTISGSNFAAGATVTIGGTPATNVTVVSGTSITARTPAHAAGAVGVTVTNSDGQSGSLANAFTYSASSITVTAPNTAVSWKIGETRNVKFSHNLGVGQTVNIEVSRDGGATWTLVSPFTTSSATSGTYVWTVSGPATAQARIRVRWTVDPLVADVSDVDFTILPSTTVTAPNTAVTWGAGSTRQITWTHNLGVGGLVDIDFSADNGATWATLAHGVASNAATSGSYVGPMPATVTTQALIRVAPSADPTAGDVSNVAFTLAAPTLTVTTPNTNVSWAVGSTRSIKWNHNLGNRDFVKIELARDGVNYTEVIAASAPNTANTNSTFTWVVTGPSTTTARVRVTWLADPALNDTSDVTFRIP